MGRRVNEANFKYEVYYMALLIIPGKNTNSFDVLTVLEVVRRLTVLKLTAK